jgi:aldose 1-epimerase
MNATNCIAIRDGDSYCLISPKQGGGIMAWSIGGQDMLRRSDSAAIASDDPLRYASFPLVPYSNRIGYGRFDWMGRSMQIRPNFAPEPHAIHGTGWQRPWQVAHLDARSCELVLDFEADEDWHWSFMASQRVEVSENGLRLTLSATNRSDIAAPLAFGHHPYFDIEGATLTFNADQIWQTGCDGLPAYREAPSNVCDFANGDPVTGRTIDNGYTGWDGKAQIRWLDRPLMLDIASDMTAAVVFVPESENYFCFEPVPHIINALNLPDHAPQMPVIAPGATYEACIDFAAKAA